MMDIYAKYGDKVMVTEETSTQGYSRDEELIKDYLELNQVYTVNNVAIDKFSSRVFLLEFPGISFNTVNFESV